MQLNLITVNWLTFMIRRVHCTLTHRNICLTIRLTVFLVLTHFLFDTFHKLSHVFSVFTENSLLFASIHIWHSKNSNHGYSSRIRHSLQYIFNTRTFTRFTLLTTHTLGVLCSVQLLFSVRATALGTVWLCVKH